MTRSDAENAELWELRYRDLEETFAMSMAASAEAMDEMKSARHSSGLSELWSMVDGLGRIEVNALLSGPVQEVSFIVQQGARTLLSGPFTPSNTLIFEAPSPGKYVVTCSTRLLSTGEPLSRKAVEVIVR